jgi:hypothetical protein
MLAVVAGCGFGSAPGSPTPFPTLLPLLTSNPSPSAAPASGQPSPTASQEPQPSTSSAPPIALPAEFTTIPAGGHTFKYEAKSKSGSLTQGTPKNMRLSQCGILSPVDVDGSLWDPMYGNDGHGGPLTDSQLGDLRTTGRVTVTLVDPNTLQMVTRNGAFITLTRHDGSRRYTVCA